MSVNNQQKLFGEENKVMDSNVFDVLGNPIQEYHVSGSDLLRPVAHVPLLDTFQQFWVELRLFKCNEDIGTMYIDGKPKVKGLKPYRFYGHFDVKQVLAAARAFFLLYKSMTGYPDSFIVGLIQSPHLIDKVSLEFRKPSYVNRKIVGSDTEVDVDSVVLDLNVLDRKCVCGFSDIIKADNFCPSCSRKFVWERK